MEELPQLPENRRRHSCAALPSNGVRFDLDQPLKPFQAFVVAGGYDGSDRFSSVVTLLPRAAAWTPLASLPIPMRGARASLFRGKIRLTGGWTGSSFFSQVTITLSISKHVLPCRCLSITQHRGTSGWLLAIFSLQDPGTLFFLLDLNSCLVQVK